MRIRVMIVSESQELMNQLRTGAEFAQNKMECLAWISYSENLWEQFEECSPRLLILDSTSVSGECADIVRKANSLKDNCWIMVIGDGSDTELLIELLQLKVWVYYKEPLDIRKFNQDLKRVSENIRNVTLPQVKHEACIAMRSLYFWKLMFENSDVAHDMDFANQIMNTNFTQGLFRILLFRFDQLHGELPNFKNTKFFSDLAPMQRKVEIIVNEYIYEFCYEMMFDFRFNGVVGIINYDQRYEQNILNTFEDIQRVVNAYTCKNYGVTVTLCVGGAYDDFTCVQQSREEAYEAAWARMKKGTSKVLYWKKAYGIQDAYEEKLNTIVENLKLASDTLNLSDMEKSIDELFELPSYVLSDYKIRDFIMTFVDYFFDVNGSILMQHMVVEQEKEIVKKTLNYSYTLDVYKQNLKQQFARMYELLEADVDKQNVRILRKAIKYIKENYDKTITAEKLAEVVNLSPVYFSHLFKKHTGRKMTDYITDYKMQIAKSKLLETDLPINEIAESVGFQEQRYFSKRFKQIVGMTPTEFRQMK